MAENIMVNAEPPKENILTALLRVQQAVPALKKSAMGQFDNKYVPLDTVLETVVPLLNAEGIIVVQAPTGTSEEPSLQTTLYHAESGTSISSTMPLMLDKDTPQGQGSGITYARRYALQGMLGLNAETDDDAAAAEPVVARAPRRRSKPSEMRIDSVQTGSPY